MTYADLLKESYEEDFTANIPENDTFAAIDSYMTENFSFLLNESDSFEANFGIEDLVFEAAEDGEKKLDVKATMANVGKTIKTAIEKLIAKIASWLVKIPDAIKRVIAKVTVTITSKQNLKVKQVIDNHKDAVLSKDITLKVMKVNNIKNISTKLDTTFKHLVNKERFNHDDIEVVSAFKEDILSSSELFESKEFKEGQKIADIWKDVNFGNIIDMTKSEANKIAENSKAAINRMKELKSGLEKTKANLDKNAKDSIADIKADIAKNVAISNAIMRLTTFALSYIAGIARYIAMSSNKLAVAAKVSGAAAAKAVKSAEKDAKKAEKNADKTKAEEEAKKKAAADEVARIKAMDKVKGSISKADATED
jgi:hypothetical protein